MNRLLVIFLVVVIDLLGFGIIVPLLPYMGVEFGASPATVTWILMSYSLSQFIATPMWGRLSDRYGRRPILLWSLAGAAVSYVLLAFAQTLEMLLVSRILGGIMAGNVSAALAYASDISKPEDRAKALGMIGAGIGIGFMLGPAIGGLLAGDDPANANFALPAWVATALAVVAMGMVAFVLPESLPAEQRASQASAASERSTPWQLLREMPGLRRITLAALTVVTAQAILESITGLWALEVYGYGPRTVGIILFGLALVAVAFQGGLTRLLVDRFGEQRTAIAGATSYALGFLLVAIAPNFAVAAVGIAFCAAGQGMWQPSASAIASKEAGPGNRGAVMGTYQSSASLARIFGPAMSGPLFGAFGPSAPFVAAAAISAIALLMLVSTRPQH